MDFELHRLLLLAGLVFFAGFVDSIAGGGGLVSLPAYLLVGLPPHLALGTNKLSSTIGTTFSALRYARGRVIELRVGLPSAGLSLVGSMVGARLALAIPETTLKTVIAVLIPMAAAGVFLGGGKRKRESTGGTRRVLVSGVVGFSIGMYDGFFGPGTGTFLIISFVLFLGMDEVIASGTAKVVNLSSNVAALVTFALGDSVLYGLGLPVAVLGVVGNWLGAELALKKGAKVIRPLLLAVLAILFVRVLGDLIR